MLRIATDANLPHKSPPVQIITAIAAIRMKYLTSTHSTVTALMAITESMDFVDSVLMDIVMIPSHNGVRESTPVDPIRCWSIRSASVSLD